MKGEKGKKRGGCKISDRAWKNSCFNCCCRVDFSSSSFRESSFPALRCHKSRTDERTEEKRFVFGSGMGKKEKGRRCTQGYPTLRKEPKSHPRNMRERIPRYSIGTENKGKKKTTTLLSTHFKNLLNDASFMI